MQWYKIFLPEIEELIQTRSLKELGEFLRTMHPADILDILRELHPTDRALAFRLLDKEKIAGVFSMLEPEEGEIWLKLLTEQRVSEILMEMTPDDRAVLMDELPADLVKKFLPLLPPEAKEITNLLLNYPIGSTGRLLTNEYVDLRPEMTAQEAIEQVRRTGLAKETIYICYVVDQTRRLIGVLSLRDIILAPPEKKIGELMNPMVFYAKTTDDQEVAAKIIQKYDLLAVPVVDQEGRLVGIVTVDDVIDIIEKEVTEDMEKMAAVRLPEEEYFRASFLKALRKRVVWLIILIAAQTITSIILRSYTSTLNSFIALSYFIPLVISSGGNTGSQSSTLVIRALATGEMSLGEWWKILRRELVIGPTLGVILGAIILFYVFALLSNPLVGMAIGVALLAVVMSGNLIGTLVPLFFRFLRWDPATVSSPMIATFSDVTGLLIYLEVTRAILHL